MFSGLKPGTNYTALLAVVSSGGGGGGGLVAVDAVAVLSGALTPDTVAPRFVSIGPMQGPSLSSAQSFAATVPLAVDKPSTVSYALYWCVNPLNPTENSELCGPDDGVDATVIGERTRDLTIHLPRPAPPPPFSPLKGCALRHGAAYGRSGRLGRNAACNSVQLHGQDDVCAYCHRAAVPIGSETRRRHKLAGQGLRLHRTPRGVGAQGGDSSKATALNFYRPWWLLTMNCSQELRFSHHIWLGRCRHPCQRAHIAS